MTPQNAVPVKVLNDGTATPMDDGCQGMCQFKRQFKPARLQRTIFRPAWFRKESDQESRNTDCSEP